MSTIATDVSHAVSLSVSTSKCAKRRCN